MFEVEKTDMNMILNVATSTFSSILVLEISEMAYCVETPSRAITTQMRTTNSID